MFGRIASSVRRVLHLQTAQSELGCNEAGFLCSHPRETLLDKESSCCLTGSLHGCVHWYEAHMPCTCFLLVPIVHGTPQQCTVVAADAALSF